MIDSRPPRLEKFRAIVFERSPKILAILTFLVGSFALISVVDPSGHIQVQKPIERLIAETPVAALTIGALALMFLSLGLLRRLFAAWMISAFVALHGTVVTLFLRPRAIEFVIYVLLLIILLISRKSFFRRSSLGTVIIPRIWVLASLCAIAFASFFALLWVSHQKGFVEASFMDLIFDPTLGVAGRPIVIAGLILGLILLYFGIARPAHSQPKRADDTDLQHITNLLQQSDYVRPDNILAYVGDKSIFYGPDQSAAIAYADMKGVRIAMGPPIGPRAHWKATLEAFRKTAENEGLRPAVYSSPPDLLPELHDLNFAYEKIGENAIINLPDFSLSGRKREVIRRSRRKLAERVGATFELSRPPHMADVIEDLRRVSDSWLNANGRQEKSFSLGRFDPYFLNHCPIGIVKIKNETVAFGNLLASPDKSWVGIDLMRYHPEKAVTNTMDFLMVELILWAKSEGYGKFDLAMAPLSGLQQENSPTLARLGHFVFEHGERFYNFQGLRRFKKKFDPDWEPRYIAAPGYLSLPIVLAHVASLTNGQPKGGYRNETLSAKVQSPSN